MARIVMRACRNPSCTKGDFPSSTARAAYCSSACRLIHHRKQKKEQQSQTQEEIPMATQSPMQFVFQESEYQTRCNEARIMYENNIESPAKHVKGRIVELSFPGASFAVAFEEYHKLRVEGFGILDPLAPLASVFVDHAQVVVLYMLKPEEQQKTELEAIYADVRAEYQAELDRGLEAEVERQVQLVLAQQDRAREQAAAQERQQREQEARDELAASRQKLRDELIKSGKLSAEGTAQ